MPTPFRLGRFETWRKSEQLLRRTSQPANPLQLVIGSTARAESDTTQHAGTTETQNLAGPAASQMGSLVGFVASDLGMHMHPEIHVIEN